MLQVGFEMATTQGSNTILDAKVTNTKVFIKTPGTQRTSLAGSIVLENAHLNNVPVVVADTIGTILPGSTGYTKIEQWIQGNAFVGTNATATFVQKSITPPQKPDVLVDDEGRIFQRQRPQYKDASVHDSSYYPTVKLVIS